MQDETIAIVSAIIFTYVHLFNTIAKLYFDSDRRLTLEDLYHKVVTRLYESPFLA
jgi:hypothetical protein